MADEPVIVVLDDPDGNPDQKLIVTPEIPEPEDDEDE